MALFLHSKPPPRTDAVYRGEIVHWNDMKGFGFIKTTEDEPNIFFHISNFAYEQRRPQKGDRIAFLLEKNKNKIQASRIVLDGHEATLFKNTTHDARKTGPYLFEAAIYAILVCLFYISLSTISAPIAVASFIISLMTVSLYSLDKHAALTDQQRVPEASLHIAALLGGWPGALIARPLLRHKTSKNRFIIFFWMSVVVNFACLYVITWKFTPIVLY